MTAAADEHRPFLRAIVERPDDDVPRLIFADRLAEVAGTWRDPAGDAADRAEFIRVQCRIEEMKRLYDPISPLPPEHQAHAEWKSLRRRERELLEVHGRKWSPRRSVGYVITDVDLSLTFSDQESYIRSVLAYHGFDLARPFRRTHRPEDSATHFHQSSEWPCEFRRGFVESVTCSCEEWLRHGVDIARAQPVVRVTLTDRRPFGPDQMALGVSLTNGRWVWAVSDNDNEPPWRIPLILWGLLKPRPPVGGYESEREAIDALSNACIIYARTRAGLPPLTATPTTSTPAP